MLHVRWSVELSINQKWKINFAFCKKNTIGIWIRNCLKLSLCRIYSVNLNFLPEAARSKLSNSKLFSIGFSTRNRESLTIKKNFACCGKNSCGVININICWCCYCKSILEVKTNPPITQPKERLITTKVSPKLITVILCWVQVMNRSPTFYI